MHREEREWGSYEVLLDAPDCKVKRITVSAGKRFSLQSHKFRNEIWTIISGTGLFSYGWHLDSVEDTIVNPGQTMEIRAGDIHRMQAGPGQDLVFIETQLGTYFGEDDIVRYEDDFGRANA